MWKGDVHVCIFLLVSKIRLTLTLVRLPVNWHHSEQEDTVDSLFAHPEYHSLYRSYG